MKNLLALLLVALMAGPVLSQDAPPPPPKQDPPKQDPAKKDPPKKDENACNLAKIELRDYCTKCAKFATAMDVSKGACKNCSTKIEKVESCVKDCVTCNMHGGGARLHTTKCCGTLNCCAPLQKLARTKWKCDKCGAIDWLEKDVKHKEDEAQKEKKCDGKIVRVCDQSGTFPHGGVEQK